MPPLFFVYICKKGDGKTVAFNFMYIYLRFVKAIFSTSFSLGKSVYIIP